MKANRTLIAGLVLVSISVLILFLIPILASIYDFSFVLYLTAVILGFPTACSGSILVTSSLPAIGKGSNDSGLLVIGIFLSLFGIILWIFTLILAFIPLGYLAILYVYSIPMSILVGLFSGWMIGLGLPGKKQVEIDEQG
jgi:hypothetical protein